MKTSDSKTTEDDGGNILPEIFNSPEVEELSNILLGMGLDEQEVLLFTERNITLEKFLRFTAEDIEHVGIEDHEKKKALVDGINQLTAKKVEEQKKKPQLVISENLSQQEFLTTLTNTLAHLKTLHATVPYVERRIEQIKGNEFLDDRISAWYTLSDMAEKAVDQSTQLSHQLQALQLQAKEAVKRRGKKKRLKNRPIIIGIITATATICCVMLWKMKSNS